MTKVSLITTVYDEAASIEAFVRSINAQSVLPDEVVVVDGGSTDGTPELIRRLLRPDVPSAIVVDPTCSRAHSAGPIARGRNVAIRAARYDHLVVTDAGCELAPGWVAAMKESFATGCDVVAGYYRARPGNAFQAYLADMFCPPLSAVDPARFLPSSRSIGFTRAIWEAAGGYPEDSYTAEDTVFDLRVYALTRKIVFNPDAWVLWELPATYAELREKLERYAEGEARQRIFGARYAARAVFLALAPLSVWYLLARRKKLITLPVYYHLLAGYLRVLVGERLLGRKRR